MRRSASHTHGGAREALASDYLPRLRTRILQLGIEVPRFDSGQFVSIANTTDDLFLIPRNWRQARRMKPVSRSSLISLESWNIFSESRSRSATDGAGLL